MNEFHLKPSYVAVLDTLKDGQPKTSVQICIDCGLERMECTGAISILRRREAISQAEIKAGIPKYKITDRGRLMLEQAPRVVITKRS